MKYGGAVDGGSNSPGRPPRGGRGLKFGIAFDKTALILSPSARRAWVEIWMARMKARTSVVALREEGVG